MFVQSLCGSEGMPSGVVKIFYRDVQVVYSTLDKSNCIILDTFE